jgi:riboflavin kinase/FMN adenylyltransferase
MLGRPYSLTGTVERGTGRGRELGYPTANIRSDPGRLIPADGVYAVEVEAERTRCQGVASIGSRPTFADADRAFEVYLPGLDSDLYGLLLTVRFWKRLRGQIAFEDPEALAAQMALDVRDAKRALAGLHLPCDMIE